MDTTEDIRRELVSEINAKPGSREALEIQYGKVWDSDQVREDFSITCFMAPFAMATHKASGKTGALAFQHYPRFYFDFTPY